MNDLSVYHGSYIAARKTEDSSEYEIWHGGMLVVGENEAAVRQEALATLEPQYPGYKIDIQLGLLAAPGQVVTAGPWVLVELRGRVLVDELPEDPGSVPKAPLA